jgi:general stress protein YciG
MSDMNQNPPQNPPRTPAKRGFAAMDAARQRAIASAGGRAAHAKGTAHEFTSEEAREAGRKGGEVVSRTRPGHMAAIGRIGGRNSHGGNRERSQQARTEAGGGVATAMPMDRENNL